MIQKDAYVSQIVERPRSYMPYQQPGSLTVSRELVPEASSPIAPATIECDHDVRAIGNGEDAAR